MIRKFILDEDGEAKSIEFEDAVVREVCVVTESKSGKQIMGLENVCPIEQLREP